MEKLPDDLEVDVLSLTEDRLPRYVVNSLRATGYDELEVIASMDVTQGEVSSCITTIEEYIERQHNSNTDMLLSCCLPESENSLHFEFPPGHRIIICKFVKEVKELYKGKQ